jgi:hypothetical protein
MRAKTIGALLAAVGIWGAFALPTGAVAKPRRIHQSASVDVEIRGRATGGFGFSLLSVGADGGVLWLNKVVAGAGEEASLYFDRSNGGAKNFAQGRVNMRIGDLGRFRGRFVPGSSTTVGLGAGCTGDPTTIEKGHFVGSFSFHGENGFTTIDSTRARGRVTRQGETSCPEPHRHRGGRDQEASRREREARERRQEEFRLLSGDAEGNIVFQADRETSPEPKVGTPTSFSASAVERADGLQVVRSASTFELGEDTATAFQVPNLAEPLAEATVSPAAPFSGSASFHLESPTTAAWTGDLAVELPGVGTVPLTGEGISVGLCHGPSHCTETLPGLLQKELEGRYTAYAEVQVITSLRARRRAS